MPTLELSDNEARVVSYILNMIANGELPVNEQTEKVCRDVVNKLNTSVY